MHAAMVVLALLQAALLHCVRAEGEWRCQEDATVRAECLLRCERTAGCVGVGRGKGCHLLLGHDASAACIRRDAVLLEGDDAPVDDDAAAAAVQRVLEDATLPAEARELLTEVDASDPEALVQALSKALQVEGLSDEQRRLLSGALQATEVHVPKNGTGVASPDIPDPPVTPSDDSSSPVIVIVVLVVAAAVLAGIAILALRHRRQGGVMHRDFTTALNEPEAFPLDQVEQQSAGPDYSRGSV